MKIILTLILITCLTLAKVQNIDLAKAINLAINNQCGVYVESLSNKKSAELEKELYKENQKWKLSLDINREINEAAQLNYSYNYENSYDYNSNYNLWGTLETEFLFGSTIRSSIGTSLTNKKDINNRKKFNLSTSFEASITQALFPEAIYYHTTKERAYELRIQSYHLNTLKEYKATILATIKKYLQVYLSQKKLDLELNQLKTKQRLQEEIYNLYKYGKKTELDYDQISIETLENKSQLSDLKKQVKTAKQTLNKILGYNIHKKIVLSTPNIRIKIITSTDINEIITNIKSNIDLTLINLQLLENKRNKAQIIAENSPYITAAGQQSWVNDSDKYKDLLDNHNSRSYLYTFSVSFPLANQKEIELLFKKNELQNNTLISSKYNKKIDILANVYDLYDTYIENRENIQIFKESINLQKKNINIQKVRYTNGNILLRDLISDQNQLKSSEIDLEEETANMYLTYLELTIELNGIEEFILKKQRKDAIQDVSNI